MIGFLDSILYFTGVCRNCRILLSEIQKQMEPLTKTKSNEEENLQAKNLSFVERTSLVFQS